MATENKTISIAPKCSFFLFGDLTYQFPKAFYRKNRKSFYEECDNLEVVKYSVTPNKTPGVTILSQEVLIKIRSPYIQLPAHIAELTKSCAEAKITSIIIDFTSTSTFSIKNTDPTTTLEFSFGPGRMGFELKLISP